MPRVVYLGPEDQHRIRQMLQTEKVENGIPSWVLTALNSRFPRLSYPQHPGDAYNFSLTTLSDSSWSDNAGHIKVDGTELLVSEPFGSKINLKMLEGLEEFVNLVDADYWFSPNSWHAPGGTVRIVIEPNRKPLII